MDLSNKTIGFAITGSFCTLKATINMLTELSHTKANIVPILSEAVSTMDTRFFLAEDFRNKVIEITGKQPIESIVDAEPIGPKSLLDILVIAPCTGNTLAKINYGITDSTVTMSAKAHLRNAKPLLIGVSTNDGLSNNAKNIGQLLDKKNIYFIPFRQDDSVKKPTSIVADFALLVSAIESALDHKQLQPILMQR